MPAWDRVRVRKFTAWDRVGVPGSLLHGTEWGGGSSRSLLLSRGWRLRKFTAWYRGLGFWKFTACTGWSLWQPTAWYRVGSPEVYCIGTGGDGPGVYCLVQGGGSGSLLFGTGDSRSLQLDTGWGFREFTAPCPWVTRGIPLWFPSHESVHSPAHGRYEPSKSNTLVYYHYQYQKT